MPALFLKSNQVSNLNSHTPSHSLAIIPKPASSPSLELHHAAQPVSIPHTERREDNLPLRALLVENPPRAVRARNQAIFGERDAAATVAAQIGHDDAVLASAGGAARGGAGGGDLVAFAWHIGRCSLFFSFGGGGLQLQL